MDKKKEYRVDPYSTNVPLSQEKNEVITQAYQQ